MSGGNTMMRPGVDIGIVRDLQERRAIYARFINPPIYQVPKETRITIDIKSGERTIHHLTPTPTPSKAVAPRPRPIKPIQPVAEPPKHTTLRGAKKIAAYAFRSEIAAIIAVCAKHWDVPPSAISGRGKLWTYVRPRQAAIHMTRKLLGISTSAIGWAIGQRDHTTVIHSIQRSKGFLENDLDFQRRYAAALAEAKGEQT